MTTGCSAAKDDTGMRFLIALVAMLMLSTAIADPAPKPTEFATADAAATWALTAVYDISPYYEYGGMIVRTPAGKFIAVRPHTDREGTSVSMDYDPEDYPYPIVATYHTHPCIDGALSGKFSNQDLSNARSFNTPSYIANFCTGEVQRWSPGDPYDKPTDAAKLLSVIGLSARQLAGGVVVGHFKVTGQVLQ